MLKNEKMAKELKEYKDDCWLDWEVFKTVIDKYTEIFEPGFVTPDVFVNSYAQVCTRCFGYGNDLAKLVPMADNLNHSSVKLSQ